MLYSFSSGTVFGRQILTYMDCPRAERFNMFNWDDKQFER